ncbi:LOW QUALITY PROTEIN: olfactory receptor 14J1 [Megaptera novaeangliae]
MTAANTMCISKMVMANVTTMSGFFLMGFSNNRELQILRALLFLLMYLLALAGNLIIITITTLDQHLQSPAYYFWKHLSLLDLSFISVTVPQSIDNLMGNVCHSQWILQVFFFTSLAWAEVAILTVVSYDRSTAICLPLHCEVIMDPRACKWAVIDAWLSGAISGILYTAATFSITFCRAKILHQFFCDIPPLLKLSCSNDYLGVIGVAAFMTVPALICFISVLLSYMHIFSTVPSIPSAEGRSKAFSTCLPHLFVRFFLSAGIFEFLKPTSDSPTAFHIMISIFYAVVPPTLNPIVHSLRNEAMKGALRKLLLGGEFTRKKTLLSCFW